MTISYHEDALIDVEEAVRYYSEISWRLVSEFEAELQEFISKVRDNPLRFHFSPDPNYRRANFRQFPYRVLYQFREEKNEVRIMVVCHNKRHPSHGLNRRWE